jgi:hypothetical protein
MVMLSRDEPVAWMGRNPRMGTVELCADKPAECVMRDFNMQPLYTRPSTAVSEEKIREIAEKHAAGIPHNGLVVIVIRDAIRQALALSPVAQPVSDEQLANHWLGGVNNVTLTSAHSVTIGIMAAVAKPLPEAPVAQAEPVLYQYRTSPDWRDEWSAWTNCKKESSEDYKRVPLLNNWRYETRALYTDPPSHAPGVAAGIEKLQSAFDDLVDSRRYRRASTRNGPGEPLCFVSTAESWLNRMTAEKQEKINRLEREVKQAADALERVTRELDLMTHKALTCGVAASHSDATLTERGAYMEKWNSPQAEAVRSLRRRADAAESEVERLRKADELVREYVSALLLSRPEARGKAAKATTAMVDYVMEPK